MRGVSPKAGRRWINELIAELLKRIFPARAAPPGPRGAALLRFASPFGNARCSPPPLEARRLRSNELLSELLKKTFFAHAAGTAEKEGARRTLGSE